MLRLAVGNGVPQMGLCVKNKPPGFLPHVGTAVAVGAVVWVMAAVWHSLWSPFVAAYPTPHSCSHPTPLLEGSDPTLSLESLFPPFLPCTRC